MAQADALLEKAGSTLAVLVGQYLTAPELAELKQNLIETYGADASDQNAAQILTTLESQMTIMWAKRLAQNPDGLTQDDVSILRPLSYCQTNELEHFAAAENTLATFVAQGKAQYGSLTAFLEAPGQSPGPNILFGQHYYYVMMENKNWSGAEEVIAAYIPVCDAKFGRSDPRTLGATISMAAVLARLGKFSEAAEMEKEVWQRIDEMEGANLQHKQDEIVYMQSQSKLINDLREGAGVGQAA